MKKLILILLLSNVSLAQELNSEIVSAEASLIVPLGNLKGKFEFAQAYGLWFKLGTDRGVAANLGINAIFLQNSSAIRYKFNDVDYIINSNKFGLDIGIRASKMIAMPFKNNYLELDFTVAFHYLDYQFPDVKNDQESNTFVIPNTTFLFAPQVKYVFNNFGFTFQYRFAPMNFIEEMESNFGNSAVSIGLVYKQ